MYTVSVNADYVYIYGTERKHTFLHNRHDSSRFYDVRTVYCIYPRGATLGRRASRVSIKSHGSLEPAERIERVLAQRLPSTYSTLRFDEIRVLGEHI